MTEVVALVSCAKSKRPTTASAAELYKSPLFRLSRSYAEAHADRWFILSAKHGLLEPTRRIAPYERTLKLMGKVERKQWADQILHAIEVAVPDGATLLVLAGQPYLADWKSRLNRRYAVEEPLRGLGLGKRLQWLKAHLGLC